MWTRHGLLLLGALVFAVVIAGLVMSRAQENTDLQVDAHARSENVRSSATPPPSAPVRVIAQRPPAARDGTIVVAEYGFVGAVGDESGTTQYLFTRGEQAFSVGLGGILDRQWRVQSVEPDRVRLIRLSDGAEGVIAYASAGSGSLELPGDVAVKTPAPKPASRRSLRGRH